MSDVDLLAWNWLHENEYLPADIATPILSSLLAAVRAEEREACRKIAKGFWLDYPFAQIADADIVCGLCEVISDAIHARA